MCCYYNIIDQYIAKKKKKKYPTSFFLKEKKIIMFHFYLNINKFIFSFQAIKTNFTYIEYKLILHN